MAPEPRGWPGVKSAYSQRHQGCLAGSVSCRGVSWNGFSISDDADRRTATGADALRLAARKPPDVVILDPGLPDPDGTEVIAGLHGWSTGVPIVGEIGHGVDPPEPDSGRLVAELLCCRRDAGP